MNYIWRRGNEEERARWFGGLGPAGLGAVGGPWPIFETEADQGCCGEELA